MNTKIVATIGPASDNEDVLQEMILAGVNVARLNFSHGSHEEQGVRINKIRKLSALTKKNIAIMLDTKGPEIRVGKLKSTIKIQVGETYTLCPLHQGESENQIPITYENIAKDVEIGNRILIDDGSISLIVIKKTDSNVMCKAENSGEVLSRKGVNLPGKEVNLPALTEEDKKDLIFGIAEEVDFIAASFIRNASHVTEIKQFLADHGSNIPIIAKLESRSGIDAMEEIIAVADGLMVARGDLGVEIPLAEITIVQKKMIKLCNRYGKPVITATQMLESMTNNPRPTRAEVTDVANAILDGSDAIMLSGESAAGQYPLEAVKTMVEIANYTEGELNHQKFLEVVAPSQTIYDAIGRSAVTLAQELGAKAIVIPTTTGETARMIARFRPQTPLAVTSPQEKVCRGLALTWGVHCQLQKYGKDYDETIVNAIAVAKAKGYLQKDDLAIITVGAPLGNSRKTNSIIAMEV